MPTPDHFYLPEIIYRDELIIDSDLDSITSQPQPGPGRLLDIALTRSGAGLERLLSSAAERLGCGPNAVMHHLLREMSARRRRLSSRLLRKPRRDDITNSFLAIRNAPPNSYQGAHCLRYSKQLENVCRTLMLNVCDERRDKTLSIYYITLLIFCFPAAEDCLRRMGIEQALEALLEPAFTRRSKDHDLLQASSRRALYMIQENYVLTITKELKALTFDDRYFGIVTEKLLRLYFVLIQPEQDAFCAAIRTLEDFLSRLADEWKVISDIKRKGNKPALGTQIPHAAQPWCQRIQARFQAMSNDEPQSHFAGTLSGPDKLTHKMWIVSCAHREQPMYEPLLRTFLKPEEGPPDPEQAFVKHTQRIMRSPLVELRQGELFKKPETVPRWDVCTMAPLRCRDRSTDESEVFGVIFDYHSEGQSSS